MKDIHPQSAISCGQVVDTAENGIYTPWKRTENEGYSTFKSYRLEGYPQKVKNERYPPLNLPFILISLF